MENNHSSGFIPRPNQDVDTFRATQNTGGRAASERNPDAVSSRLDQANENLRAIESALYDLLDRVRGPSASTKDASANSLGPNILIRTQDLLSTIERISTAVSSLQSML